MTFRKALLAATMLALPVAAQAQPVTGLYVGAGIGINMLMETDVDLNNRFTARPSFAPPLQALRVEVGGYNAKGGALRRPLPCRRRDVLRD